MLYSTTINELDSDDEELDQASADTDICETIPNDGKDRKEKEAKRRIDRQKHIHRQDK